MTVGNLGSGVVTLGNFANSGGTLRIGSGGAAGSLNAAEVTGGLGVAAVEFNHTDALTFAPKLTGSLSVTKSGLGVATLNKANTYTGTTTVSQGTLLINGNQSAATGIVSVASGATLGGGGTIGGNTTISGTLSPGPIAGATGTITFAGDLSFAPVSKLTMELGGATSGLYDHVLVGGLLTAAGTLELTLSGGYTPVAGATFDLLDASSVSGTFASIVAPNLGPTLSWNYTNLYTTGQVSVQTVVPPPSGPFTADFNAAALGVVSGTTYTENNLVFTTGTPGSLSIQSVGGSKALALTQPSFLEISANGQAFDLSGFSIVGLYGGAYTLGVTSVNGGYTESVVFSDDIYDPSALPNLFNGGSNYKNIVSAKITDVFGDPFSVDNVGITITGVPEPKATALFVALGLGGLILLRHRRASQPALDQTANARLPIRPSRKIGRKLCFAVLLLAATTAGAATVLVDSKATGGFGRYTTTSSGGSDLVLAWTFTAHNQTISLTSTGLIDLSNALPNNGPNGISVTVDGTVVTQISYTPLEQKAVQAGTLAIPRPLGDSLLQVGALMAAFVPASTAGLPNFQPRDPTTVSAGGIGISASSLVFVGTGSFSFTSTEAGTLYLGINDLFPSNNFNVTAGGFTVQIVSVPEPATALLTAFGLSVVFIFVLRRNRTGTSLG